MRHSSQAFAYPRQATMVKSQVAALLISILTLSEIHHTDAFASHSFISNPFPQYYDTNKKATSLLLQSTSSNNDSSTPLPSVLCIGETLWDSLPSGIYLGGAPSNVAVHLAYLFNNSQSSTTVAVSACLGNDQLGREAQRRLALNGVRTDYIQYHPEWETGMATALLDSNGDATYEFNTPGAWDGLCLDSNLTHLMQEQQEEEQQQSINESPENGVNNPVLFVMGTIAGRLDNDHGATSLSTLMSVRNTAPEGTVIMDINLRSPWYKDDTVLELIRGSSEDKKKLALLKVNEEELAILEKWCGFMDGSNADDLFGDAIKSRMEKMATSLNTQRLCVTRGEHGAALYCNNSIEDIQSFHENPGYSLANKNDDCDTVGAGDSFLASLIHSLFIHEEPADKALERACALGGYVAGCRGATPVHEAAPDELRKVFSITC